MKRLIFVDDEPRVLSAMKRMLYPLRHEWEMEFVGGAAEALDRLSLADFDVLVTDLMMPCMSGVDLLQAVVERHPTVVRMVLSGAADQSSTLAALRLAHQYLLKPCDSETLRQLLQRAMTPRFLPEGSALQKFVVSVRSLPVLPTACMELLGVLNEAEVAPERVATAITADMAITAKVLQFVNSPYFCLQRQISNPVDAVRYLGTDAIRGIVSSAGATSRFGSQEIAVRQIATLRDHSLEVAKLARKFATGMGLSPAQIGEVYIGGLLHDVGALILASYDPEGYREVHAAAEQGDEAVTKIELQLYGATHAQVGAHLLWFWGLADLTTQIVALHHGPLPSPGDAAFGPLVAVRAADDLVRDRANDRLEWLSQTVFVSSLPSWMELSGEVRV